MNDRQKSLARKRISPKTSEIFVGGLPSKMNADDVKAYFGKFGKVKAVRLMRYKDMKSRGFGFIRFCTREAAIRVLTSGTLEISGKAIECKIAVDKHNSPMLLVTSICKRIYVGKLPPTVQANDLEVYFESFGTVVSVRIITAQQSGKSRGFAFVTFASETSVKMVLGQQMAHIIKNTPIEVKPAELRAENKKKLSLKFPELIQRCKTNHDFNLLHKRQYDNYMFRWHKNPGHPKMKQIEASLAKTMNPGQSRLSTQVPISCQAVTLKK